jgi:hypothetical protein
MFLGSKVLPVVKADNFAAIDKLIAYTIWDS